MGREKKKVSGPTMRVKKLDNRRFAQELSDLMCLALCEEHADLHGMSVKIRKVLGGITRINNHKLYSAVFKVVEKYSRDSNS